MSNSDEDRNWHGIIIRAGNRCTKHFYTNNPYVGMFISVDYFCLDCMPDEYIHQYDLQYGEGSHAKHLKRLRELYVMDKLKR